MNTKEWVEEYGELPFKMYKKNGEEVIFLTLDDNEENELYDIIDKAGDIACDLLRMDILFGITLDPKEVIEKNIDVKKMIRDLMEVNKSDE